MFLTETLFDEQVSVEVPASHVLQRLCPGINPPFQR
jgi:hypothetical protein